jgi:hypothetical protein
MAQLSYDEIRLLRELKNSERRISGNKLDVGFERLVKEVMRQHSIPTLLKRFTQSRRRAGLGCAA